MVSSAGGHFPLRIVGRYALYGEIAAGGMATVHFGRLVGPVGFSRTVAIKRLHPQFARDPDFTSMFLDEARLAARIQHPNVVATHDVVAMDDEVFLVMEYVHGETLSKLIRAARRRGVSVPERIAVGMLSGALHGLHAAHEAKSEKGEPLNIVHRDISPQNIIVGTDGTARVLDFGVAKAAMRAQTTREGQMKGKISYMSPEQLRGKDVDRRTDVFAAGVVLWEALTGHRLFDGNDAGEVLTKLLHGDIARPSQYTRELTPAIDLIVMKSLERDPTKRYQTTREFAIALENSIPVALPRHVGEWVLDVGGEILAKRAETVADIESNSAVTGIINGPDASGQHRAPNVVPIPTESQSAALGRTVALGTPPAAVSALTARPGALMAPQMSNVVTSDPGQVYPGQGAPSGGQVYPGQGAPSGQAYSGPVVAASGPVVAAPSYAQQASSAQPLPPAQQASHPDGTSVSSIHPGIELSAVQNVAKSSAPAERHRPSSRGVIAALVGIAGALGIALLILVLVLVSRSALRGGGSAVVTSEEAGEPTESKVEGEAAGKSGKAPPAPTEKGASDDGSSDRSGTAKSATASASAAPPVGVSPAPPSKSAVRPVAETVKPPMPTPETLPEPAAPETDPCEPPYIYDEGGIKRVKPGCG